MIQQFNPSKCSVVVSDPTRWEERLQLCRALSWYLRRMPDPGIWPTEFTVQLDYVRRNEVVVSVEHRPQNWYTEQRPTHTFAIVGPQWARQAAAVIARIAPTIRWDTP